VGVVALAAVVLVLVVYRTRYSRRNRINLQGADSVTLDPIQRLQSARARFTTATKSATLRSTDFSVELQTLPQ
jgi:hypothetical protein